MNLMNLRIKILNRKWKLILFKGELYRIVEQSSPDTAEDRDDIGCIGCTFENNSDICNLESSICQDNSDIEHNELLIRYVPRSLIESNYMSKYIKHIKGYVKAGK